MTTNYHRFVTVDVFAYRQFAGNPVAVFPDAAGIARRRLSFILPPTLA